MKIDPSIQASELQNNQVGTAKAGAAKPAETSAVSTKGATGQDTVQLSGQLNTIAHLTSQLSGVPELRADRVTAFQSKLQQGTYTPDSGKVADAILAQQVHL